MKCLLNLFALRLLGSTALRRICRVWCVCNFRMRARTESGSRLGSREPTMLNELYRLEGLNARTAK